MSQNVFIFITSAKDEADFAQEIATIFDVQLHSAMDENCSFAFADFDNHLHCFICKNVYDISDLSEQNYQYQLSVYAQGYDQIITAEMQINHGKHIFNKLKETKQYTLLLIMGFWNILDQFTLTLDE